MPYQKSAALIAMGVLTAIQSDVFARGVSPYLPLHLEPEIESQIERVLILADKPVMRRPIAAATVLDALPRVCKIDYDLCMRVGRYLARYMHSGGLTHASVEGAVTSGADIILPDSYGEHANSNWNASVSGYFQPNDFMLLNLGAVGYSGKADFTGSMVSMGFSWAQLDIGYRPQWSSPMTDSSMLVSTEAPTMPSVTLSNYKPFSPLGLQYEFFLARMSTTSQILYKDKYASGNPRLAGLSLTMEPTSGWSLGASRLLQYGGGPRPGSLKDLFRALVNPSKYDNVTSSTLDQGFGNEQAALSSTLLFPGKVPFSVYAEYAGEDTSRGRNYLLGNSALSVGIHFPSLWHRFDLTLETSEWQNLWYVHEVYQDGMVNDYRVIGSWFGDQRVFRDGVGGNSQMVRLGWQPPFGGLLSLQYRTSQNASYGVIPYDRFQEGTLTYSHPWHGLVAGGELRAGRDVMGSRFTRIGGFLRYDNNSAGLSASALDAFDASNEEGGANGPPGELFVDTGVNLYKVRVDLTDEPLRTTGPRQTSPHFAFGARRQVSQHSDLGVRLELDNIDGHELSALRLVDYRFRFRGPLAFGAFLGAARYSLPTPAYGLYYGFGLQWRNLLPHLDLGAEFRVADSVARDHLLATDPHVARPDSFYDVWGTTIALSYHF